MQTIKTAGLVLRHPTQPPQSCHPLSITSLNALDADHQSPDFILLTVKTPAVPQAIEQLQQARLDLDRCSLVSLQNGVGSEERLIKAFGANRVMAATITVPIRTPEVGVIEVSKAKGGVGVAAVDAGQSEPCEILAQALNQAGLITQIYDDYRAMKWSKLLLNMVNNATAAILNQPPIEIIANPSLFNLEIEALQEAVAVMQAMHLRGVKLPGYPSDWLAWAMGQRWLPKPLLRPIMRPFMVSGRGNKMPSLQIDLAAGRTTSEIEALNGAVVQAGRAHGLPTPVNQTLTEILHGLVHGTLDWAEYQHQPEKLLRAVEARR